MLILINGYVIMAATLKSKLAIGALVIAGLAFLDGISLLCYCPGPFLFAAPFTVAAVILGSRWSIRLIGICLCVTSIAMGSYQFERKQHIVTIIKAVRAKAETNSISK
jgi:hypothetical protein